MGAAAVVAAEDDEMMADVAAMVGGAQGSDALASLETTLRPIEKYAVRLVEEVRIFKGVYATHYCCGCFMLQLIDKCNVRLVEGRRCCRLCWGRSCAPWR